jgi:apolipoprotein N-acyltransferase
LGQAKLKNLQVLSCFAASAILLTVIQQPFNLSFLAWIALVPFVIGCLSPHLFAPWLDKQRLSKSSFAGEFKIPLTDANRCGDVISKKIWPTVLFAYLVSLVYWLGNLYWMILVTIPGGIAFCIYIAIYWPILAICLRYCAQRKVPLWFALPILVVGAEAFQGLCFRGFGWRYLGHSQYANITIIQIADIFGAAAVSFLVAMVNGAVCEIILSFKNSSLRKSALVGSLITITIAAAAIFYGRYRINQTAAFLENGPVIGVVQPNLPVEAGKETEPLETTFLKLLIDSRTCFFTAKPSLIIWPETMVEAVLDDSYLKLVSDDDTAKIFHSALLRHSGEGVYLLVGAFAGDAERIDDSSGQSPSQPGKIKLKTSFNSAFLYEPNQAGARQQYNKIHLVPFGEYIPFKDILPVLNRFLIELTPYDYDYTLNAGQDFTVFKIKAGNKTYRFGVMICYEDTVPKIARTLTLDKNKNKQIDWLVNISNDGWFVRQEKEKIKPTVELGQHTAICVFRAVENRVPIIRSVNTGISCYIDSLGRLHNDYIDGTVAKQVFDRAGQSGWFADQIVIDKRVTFFSQTGQRLEISCGVCLIFTVFVSIYKSRKHNAERS